MGKEEKVAALSKLMVEGILTADEFTRLIAALNSDGSAEKEVEKTPAQITYENYITQVVANAFKSPASVKFPPFDPSMVKEGFIKLDFRNQNVRYIEKTVTLILMLLICQRPESQSLSGFVKEKD